VTSDHAFADAEEENDAYLSVRRRHKPQQTPGQEESRVDTALNGVIPTFKASGTERACIRAAREADGATKTSLMAPLGLSFDNSHAQAFKDEVVSCLNDDALRVVSSAKWANHQLALMARIEALEKTVLHLSARHDKA
jgi:hypothetical protein